MLRALQTTMAAGLTLAAGLMLAGAGFAQAPAGAPAGSTGLCKDGSYWTGPTKRGACHGHKGVQAWYAAANGESAKAAAAEVSTGAAGAATAAATGGTVATGAAAASAAPTAAAPTAAAPAAASAMTRSHSPRSPSSIAAAPGGGPGLVWVNKSSKVYHCSSDRWYGKTKEGAYMSEADAKAQGNRPDHGKACQ
jgi:hypothetical protein